MIAQKLDAVLPLTLKDYPRFEILYRSLQRFFSDLNICWVIVPEREYERIKEKINDQKYRVISEESLIPELKFYRAIGNILYRLHAQKLMKKILSRSFDISGWYIQQLVKMAIAERVETNFYLTLDADVICLKPVRFSHLIKKGRAVTLTSRKDWHPNYYLWAERLLGLTRSGLNHGVTPAVLNKEAMLKLQEYLGKRVNFVFKSLSILLPRKSMLSCLLVSWRAYLLRNIPLAEYALYNTFLEAKGIYDKYHFQGGECAIYDVYNSVWFKEDFTSWNPQNLNQNSFFTVVQSNTGIKAEQVLDKIGLALER